MAKVTDLPVATVADPTDPIMIVDGSDGLSKQVTVDHLNPNGPIRWDVFDDMIAGRLLSWDTSAITGTGTAALVGAGNANAADALGIMELATGAAAGKANVQYGASAADFPFRGSIGGTFECRAKLPATPTDIQFLFEISDGSGSHASMDYDEGVGTWTFTAESTDGGGYEIEASAIAATAGWHTFRIVIAPGLTAKFYIDGVLQHTLIDPTAIPAADDAMTFFIQARRVAIGPTKSVFIDWVRGYGNRF